MNQVTYLYRLTNCESYRVLLYEIVPYGKPTQPLPDEAPDPWARGPDFDRSDITNIAAAPSLRLVQEPALSLPKGRVRCC